MTTTHTFTESGLGLAPFKLVGVDERHDGCRHCGTAIKHRFHIRSADGIHSVVGSSCIGKTGDAGLIDLARREKNRRIREIKRAKEEKIRNARLDAERNRNGGLTDFEVKEKKREEEINTHLEKMAPVVALAAKLADGKGGFRDSVAADLARGIIPSPRAIEIIIKILGEAAREAFNEVN